MENKKNSFINGAAILSLAGIIVKILGAVFRLPLAHIVGSEGMGLYQLAYPMYSFLLIVSTAGFPVAISRLVAESVNTGNYKLADRTFRLSSLIMGTLGAIGTVLMLALSGIISRNQGNADSQIVLMAIAPAIFFVAILSSYRGYFQGLQNMIPTAATQIIEQLIKLLAGLVLALILVPYGVKWGAFGAISGVTISELVALVFVIVLYRKKKPSLSRSIPANNDNDADYSAKKIIGNILKISIPIAIGSAVMPLVSMVDQLIVINGLKSSIDGIQGIPFNTEEFAVYALKNFDTVVNASLPMTELASLFPEIYEKFITSLSTSLYGISSGICSPIIALPLVFSTSLSISIVPAISQAHATANKADACKKAETSLRLTTLISFPCAVGLMAVSEPVIRTLYGSYPEWQILIASNCLKFMALSILVLPLVYTSTAILQGTGKQNIPVIVLAIGCAAVKIPLSYFLTSNPTFNIIGSVIGTDAIYLFAGIVDTVFVCTVLRFKLNIFTTVIKPLFASAIMGVVAYVLYELLIKSLGRVIIALAGSIIVAVLLYFALVFVTKMIRKSDLEFIPKGEIIGKKLGRFLGE